jgi:hypothetical protein
LIHDGRIEKKKILFSPSKVFIQGQKRNVGGKKNIWGQLLLNSRPMAQNQPNCSIRHFKSIYAYTIKSIRCFETIILLEHIFMIFFMLLGEIYKTDIIIVFIPPLKNTCEYDLLV